jgi:sugar lactone lactonase YvrE
MARFAAHGLALRPGKGGAHLLYAVNHGGRESVEVFKVRASGGAVRLTWIGCAVMPEGANPNSVAPTPEGGFVVSKFDQAGDAQGFAKMSRKEVTGVLYEWRPRHGFREIPRSAFSGDNGVAVSPDGRWVFVNAWPEQRVVRLDRSGKLSALAVQVDFLPDNLRWAPDGRLLVAGQASDIKALLACDKPRCPHGWAVVALDPKTMRIDPLVREPGRDAFSDATGALMVGDELWVGTYRGDRIAYVRLGRHH